MNKEDRIKEILEKYKEYQYSRELKHYSAKYKKEIGHSFWGSINNNDDVDSVKQSTENTINYFKKFEYKLADEDISKIELEIGKYEEAISKVINCYDNSNCNFLYTEEELLVLIKNLENYNNGLADVRMRKACQD